MSLGMSGTICYKGGVATHENTAQRESEQPTAKLGSRPAVHAWRTPTALVLALTALASACADEELRGLPPGEPPSDTNRPPTAVAELDQSWVGIQLQVGDTIVLDGTKSSDPDGDPLTYLWRIEAQPDTPGTEVQQATQARALLPLTSAGTYEVQLEVEDPDGLASDDLLVLDVAPAAVVFEDGPFDLVVENWNVQPSECYTATLVASGTVTVQRDDPLLELWFGTSALTGTIDDNEHFTVTLTQQFDWADGCRWQSVEQLVGDFTSPDAFSAAHSYWESVVSGSGCVPPCTVTSTVHGTRL